jgi:LemA protein
MRAKPFKGVNMVFLGHLLIAFAFTILLYMGATYSSLSVEIDDVKSFRNRINTIIAQRQQFLAKLNALLKQSTIESSLLNEAEMLASLQNDFQRLANETKLSEILTRLEQELGQYPQLQGNTEAMQLQQNIAACERQLAYNKDKYNTAVGRFHTHKKSIFSVGVLKLFKKLDQQFVLWQ